MAAGLMLPIIVSTEAAPGQAVPPKPAYDVAWTTSVEAGDATYLLPTEVSVIVSGPGRRTEAYWATDGTVAWDYPESVFPLSTGDGLVHTVVGAQLHALEALTGALHWVTDVGQAVQGPTSAPGFVIVATDEEALAVRSSDGTIAWRISTPRPLARPVVDAGRVFLIVQGLDRLELVAITLDTGGEDWRRPLYDPPGEMLAAHGSLLFGTTTGRCYAYRQRDGRIDWVVPTRVAAVGLPAADEQRAYFALNNNSIRMFDRRSGNLRATRMLDDRPASGVTLLASGLLVSGPHGELLNVPVDGGTPSRLYDPASTTTTTFERLAVSEEGGRIYLLTSSVYLTGPALNLTALGPGAPR